MMVKYNDDGGRGKCPGNETKSEVVLQSQNHKLSSLGDNVFEGEKQYDDPKIGEKKTQTTRTQVLELGPQVWSGSQGSKVTLCIQILKWQ